MPMGVSLFFLCMSITSICPYCMKPYSLDYSMRVPSLVCRSCTNFERYDYWG